MASGPDGVQPTTPSWPVRPSEERRKRRRPPPETPADEQRPRRPPEEGDAPRIDEYA